VALWTKPGDRRRNQRRFSRTLWRFSGLALGAKFLQGDEVATHLPIGCSVSFPGAAELPGRQESWQRCLFFLLPFTNLGSTELPIPKDSSVADV